MQFLEGTLIRYPWGTYDAIAGILGKEPDGQPLAELWLGAHPAAPARLGDTTLDAALAADPSALGEASQAAFGPQLPFLMKILSARHALSLQAHPSRDEAERGFAAEEAAGIARDDPHRTYRDDWPKPEILVALEPFHTLFGFRSPLLTWHLFHQLGVGADTLRLLGPLNARGGEAALQEVFLDVLTIEGDRMGIVTDVLACAREHARDEGPVGDLARTAVELEAVFGTDRGILAALLMNRLILAPGEAVYVPAGVMHAHLAGTGIEVMASSDNVLRGGLTSKHIAVDELVRVVDFAWCTPEVLHGDETAPGVFDYPTHCDEFDVWRLEATSGRSLRVPADGHARIALVTRGDAHLSSAAGDLTLARGEAAFLGAADADVTLRGDAQVFLSAPGLATARPAS